ncbi:GNAT family N-acetyltransferase [Nocardioides sp. MJB4]|uniref:GNAT family N-acetyltransferase n=1 Tax=Nocardioides donggukensis TaxID=2774019 RepID=A0A927K4H0_9ACTN|nr:GNAT family N-acetyltransferase [Nocardioides donggukensis]
MRPEDAPDLVRLWEEVVPRASAEQMLVDMELVVDQSLASARDRIVVAECDGRLAGAVYLRVGPMSPLHVEPVVQAVSPHVLPEFRRHGVGRALMDAAVAHAEEKGIGHVASASLSASREAHRFLARLALAPQAVLRVAPTQVVRAKLSSRRPARSQTGGRPALGQVLAARRSQRRQRDLV